MARELFRIAANVEAMRSAFIAWVHVRREALRIALVGVRRRLRICPAHCYKVVACCQWTSGTQKPAAFVF